MSQSSRRPNGERHERIPTARWDCANASWARARMTEAVKCHWSPRKGGLSKWCLNAAGTNVLQPPQAKSTLLWPDFNMAQGSGLVGALGGTVHPSILPVESPV